MKNVYIGIGLAMMFLQCANNGEANKIQKNEKSDTTNIQVTQDQKSFNIQKGADAKKVTPFFLDFYHGMSKVNYETIIEGYSLNSNSNIKKFLQITGNRQTMVYCYSIILSDNRSLLAYIEPTFNNDKLIDIMLVFDENIGSNDYQDLLKIFLDKYGVPKINFNCKSSRFKEINADAKSWMTTDKFIDMKYNCYLTDEDIQTCNLFIYYNDPNFVNYTVRTQSAQKITCESMEDQYLKSKGLPTIRQKEKSKNDL